MGKDKSKDEAPKEERVQAEIYFFNTGPEGIEEAYRRASREWRDKHPSPKPREPQEETEA